MHQGIGKGRNERSGTLRLMAWTAAAGLMLLIIAVRLAGGLGGWSTGDVVLVAAILLAACLVFDLATRLAPNASYLAGTAVALLAGAGLVVVNGAVGLVGAEDEPHNRLFVAVILVALTTAALTRGRPEGMARAMIAAAVVHVALSAALLGAVGVGPAGHMGIEAVGLSGFAALWLAAAWLYRRSAITAD